MKITVKGDVKRVTLQVEPVEDGCIAIPDFVAFKLSAILEKAAKHNTFVGHVTYVEGKWRCWEEYEMSEAFGKLQSPTAFAPVASRPIK